MLKTCLLGAAAVLSLAAPGASFAVTATPTLQDRQQAACYNDVQRLCADAIPDVDRVTACMRVKRSEVSARCAKFYGQTK